MNNNATLLFVLSCLGILVWGLFPRKNRLELEVPARKPFSRDEQRELERTEALTRYHERFRNDLQKIVNKLHPIDFDDADKYIDAVGFNYNENASKTDRGNAINARLIWHLYHHPRLTNKQRKQFSGLSADFIRRIALKYDLPEDYAAMTTIISNRVTFDWA